MEDNIFTSLREVSLSQDKGRFLSDKSYAYDNIYFMAKYIEETADSANIFNKNKEKPRFKEYTKDIFQLRGKGSGAINYMTEALSLLKFAGVLELLGKNSFKIRRADILNYITERVENAYIFLYLIVYRTFVNENLMDYYTQFIKSNTALEKEKILHELLQKFQEKSISIGGRKSNEDSNWSKQLVKYAMVVLGYANNGEYVTRTLKVHSAKTGFKKVDIKDISINIEGTRTNQNSKKINDYIYSFDKKYVQFCLKKYLLGDVEIDNNIFTAVSHIAEDLASLKIEKIIKSSNAQEYYSKYEQNQFVERKIKARNNNIQKTFKEGLLSDNAHRCPICGFEYEDFLIASHIRPYSKCDDTYDAVNKFNGLLLCPNHDRLFEGGKLMTIDAVTGQIILAKNVLDSKDYGYLNGQCIDKSLVECERRHYLRWHNEQFYKYNENE